MRSLHFVYEMNAYRTAAFCLSVHMIQFDNQWTDFDEIWCGPYVTVYLKIVLLNFLQPKNQHWGRSNL
jgi:hypothetical protein